MGSGPRALVDSELVSVGLEENNQMSGCIEDGGH